MIFIICFIIAFIPVTLIFPTMVKGRKNLPRKGGVILACNHQSAADPAIIAVKLCRRRFKFMAKKEAFEKNKFFAWLLTKFGAYPVDRAGNDIAAIKKTFKFLKDGKAVCIFPEGHRIKDENGGELKNGVVMISLKTKTPIVPCIIKKCPKFFRFNKMKLGEEIRLYEMEEFKDKKVDKELLDKASEYLSLKFDELRDSLGNKKEKKND